MDVTPPTRAQAAEILVHALAIRTAGDAENLHGLFPHVFPGEYHGEMDEAFPDKIATLEVVIVALVRWAGWDTVRYDRELVPRVLPFVSPGGFPVYAPDPTPRSIPYIVAALENGLISNDTLSVLLDPVSRDTIDELCLLVKKRRDTADLIKPLLLDQVAHVESTIDSIASPRQLLIVPEGWHDYHFFHKLPNPVLSFGASSLRLSDAASPLCTWQQDYFPLGPLDSLLTVGKWVSDESYSHQSQALYARIDNASTTVNAVGLWGCAQSVSYAARVWAGFLQCSTSNGPDKDAQAIGLEIDIINNTLPGSHPNRSKTGLQIVGIGTAACTNAVEILGSGAAQWYNGILISENTIHEDGTVLGVAQKATMARGIDLSHSTFTDAAIKIATDSKVSFKSKSGANAEIYTDNIDHGILVLRCGKSGLRIVNNENSKNIIWILPDGTIHPSSVIVSKYRLRQRTTTSLFVLIFLMLAANFGLSLLLNNKAGPDQGARLSTARGY